MTRTGIAVAVAVLLLGSARADEKAMKGIFPYETHVETLDNGLKVIVVPMPSGGLAAYWSIVRTGSRDEVEPGHTGFAHFFEHMMFRGTKRFPQEVYGAAVTSMGADANAFTSDDLTAYHLAIASEDLERVMELESDRFQNLDYSEQAFKTESGAVYGEYRKSRTSPYFSIYEAIRAAAFHEHTYGHTTMGFEQDIKAMPTMYDYSRSFFTRFYRPDNVVLLVVGDVEPGRVMTLARRSYGDWKPGYQAPQIKAEPPQTQERRVEVAYEGRSLPILWLAYKGPAFDPADRLAASADVLGELVFGETSEVYRKLVLDERSVESLQAGLGVHRDPGLFDVTARVKDPARVDHVLSELDRAIAEAQQEAPDRARLDAVRSRMRYEFLMGLDSPDAVASTVARTIAITGGIEAVDRLFRTYDALTPEDVQAAARTILDRDRRTVGVLEGARR